jgi:hypothetical protein
MSDASLLAVCLLVCVFGGILSMVVRFGIGLLKSLLAGLGIWGAIVAGHQLLDRQARRPAIQTIRQSESLPSFSPRAAQFTSNGNFAADRAGDDLGQPDRRPSTIRSEDPFAGTPFAGLANNPDYQGP